MTTGFPQITFVYDRQKRASMNKKSSIEIRVTYNRKQKYMSTGIRIYPNQWKKQRVVNCPDSMEINVMLDTMLQDIRQAILEMGRNINLSLLPFILEKKKTIPSSFSEYCRTRSEIRKYGKANDSQERYDRFLRLFSQWGKIVSFEDVTDHNIIAYDKYLQSTGMKPYSKWNNYHRFLNSFITDAINEGLIQRNPYKWIDIDRGEDSEGIHKYLTPEEINKLKKAAMPTESLERIKDLFLFQTYTCMSYSDLKKFDYKNIQLIKGMPVYIGKRTKTGKQYIIPLLSQTIDILNKYNNKLPMISNVKYNLYLKAVAQSAKIDKPLSSHWARHTGATLLLNEGISMQVISKICGHSSTKITERIYAKLLDETVVDAIKNSPIFSDKGGNTNNIIQKVL